MRRMKSTATISAVILAVALAFAGCKKKDDAAAADKPAPAAKPADDMKMSDNTKPADMAAKPADPAAKPADMAKTVDTAKPADTAAPAGTAINGYDDYKSKSVALAGKMLAVFKKDATDCDALAADVTTLIADPDFVGINAYEKAHDADKKKFDTESAALEKDFETAATPVMMKCKDNKKVLDAFSKMQ
jgi:hypothetical protein